MKKVAMSSDLVSIIVPAYNAEKYLEEALESVMAQTHTNYEILLVDDGSTDSTPAIAKKWVDQLTFLQQKHQGISAARNLALEKARGEFIAFLDADDVWLPTKLAEQLEYLKSNPEMMMVFSLAQNVLHSSVSSPKLHSGTEPIIAAHIPANCLFRRSVITSVGLFNPEITFGEFTEWYARAVNKGIKIGCVQSLLLLRRVHGENIGITKHNELPTYLHILKKKIDEKI